jgi:hypothetical protein
MRGFVSFVVHILRKDARPSNTWSSVGTVQVRSADLDELNEISEVFPQSGQVGLGIAGCARMGGVSEFFDQV